MLSDALRLTFNNLVNRLTWPKIVFFPFLAKYYMFSQEREYMRNSLMIRGVIEGIVERRRAAIKKDPKLAEADDFLTILLCDDVFKEDNTRIIDETLTFFFAGSQTSAVTLQNLVVALLKNPEYLSKITDELDDAIVQPHLQELIKSGKAKTGDQFGDLDLIDLITFENNSDLQFYGNCFNESLRMQPPVYYSSFVCMSETVKCGPLTIRKGDPISVGMYSLCNNPGEWIEPEKFIPERFDENSEYFFSP